MTGIGSGSPAPQISESRQDIGRQRKRAIAATAVLILYVFAWLCFEIPKGTLTHTDELLTAERSREMLATEPWVVH